MRHYLIVYDRSDGEIVLLQRFSDPQEALARRFAYERYAKPSEEVVVLSGASLEAVRRTHGRYFYTVRELAQRLQAAATEAKA